MVATSESAAVQFVKSLLDPEMRGFAADKWLRDDAREVLGRVRVESQHPPLEWIRHDLYWNAKTKRPLGTPTPCYDVSVDDDGFFCLRWSSPLLLDDTQRPYRFATFAAAKEYCEWVDSTWCR